MGIKRILIIDDEKDLYVLMAKNLERTGDFSVTYALTGKEGIELVKSFQPNLIFLDIKLQDADGTSLISKILKLNRDIRIIILSGKGTHDYVQIAFEAGAVDFVTKPCDTSKLMDLIQKHLCVEPKFVQSTGSVPEVRAFTRALFLDVLASFVSILEAKSKYLKGHSERVARLSKKVGLKMGLSKAQVEILECSAILHDLGKVGIKDTTLNKEGKFTEEEWKDMMKHSVIGSEIINKVRFFRLEEPIIRHHHERFDGGGYPDGIKGKNIPLEAGIIALADAYDAMISKRPYRDRMTREQAISEIERNSGTQFNPELVDQFMQIVRSEKGNTK